MMPFFFLDNTIAIGIFMIFLSIPSFLEQDQIYEVIDFDFYMYCAKLDQADYEIIS